MAFAASMLGGLALAAMVLSAPPARAATYKWVDDQGVVHYTDKMPPEAINKGNVELNKQGVPIKKTEPALTPEQRRVREAEEERARQAAKAREEVARKDRALLQSYTTESEIDLSKKRALGTIDAQMQSAQAYVAILTKRKDEIQVRVAALNGKPQPASLEREVANVNEELEKQADLIATKRKELAVVTARYDADKQRWRELKQIAEAEAEAANAAPAKGAAPPGVNPAAAKGTPPPVVNPAAVPTSTKK
jgi:chromosome segregation ATPase